jgi:hypothetical protein
MNDVNVNGQIEGANVSEGEEPQVKLAFAAKLCMLCYST